MKPIQLHLIVESTALTLIRHLTSKFVPLQSGAQAHQQVVIPALWMGRDTRGTKTYITESGALLVMVPQPDSQRRTTMENDLHGNSLKAVGTFLSAYATHMMGCGVHTSRVVRCTQRIGESYGYTVVTMMVQKGVLIKLYDPKSNTHFAIQEAIPPLPISFEHNARLSALSWEVVDEHLTLDKLRERYEQILAAPRTHPLFVLILVGLANASFCRLFGGDLPAMGIVFWATIVGFICKQKLIQEHINHYIAFMVSAFVASLCTSISLIFDTDSEIALTTSVLYLVPGVPLINGVIDIVEGYIQTGFSRLVEAFLLIGCIGWGFSITLFIFRSSLL